MPDYQKLKRRGLSPSEAVFLSGDAWQPRVGEPIQRCPPFVPLAPEFQGGFQLISVQEVALNVEKYSYSPSGIDR